MKRQHSSASSGALTQFEYGVLNQLTSLMCFVFPTDKEKNTQESWILTNTKSNERIRMGVHPQAEEERLMTSSQRWGLSAGILGM